MTLATVEAPAPVNLRRGWAVGGVWVEQGREGEEKGRDWSRNEGVLRMRKVVINHSGSADILSYFPASIHPPRTLGLGKLRLALGQRNKCTFTLRKCPGLPAPLRYAHPVGTVYQHRGS